MNEYIICRGKTKKKKTANTLNVVKYSKTWLIRNLRDQKESFCIMKNLYNSKFGVGGKLADNVLKKISISPMRVIHGCP
jgi:hypothetical protein